MNYNQYLEEYILGRNDAIDGKICEANSSEAYLDGYNDGKQFMLDLNKQKNLEAVHGFIKEHEASIRAKLKQKH